MMKTPDEIKKGLECCECGSCPWHAQDEGCLWDDYFALSCIQQLEAEKSELLEKIKQLKCELGAAVMALATCAMDGLDGNICKYCTHKHCDEMDLHYECFEWRGVCDENSPANPGE